MKYVVFEAGSRAGLSAEMFFRHYVNNNWTCSDKLIMVDDDLTVNKVVTEKFNNGAVIERVSSNELSFDSDTVIFPADELSRQRMTLEAYCDDNSRVDKNYYNKSYVNGILGDICGNDSQIKIPVTFGICKVFIKPNSESAGSKGLYSFENACVSQKIDIEEEYVIDVLRNDEIMYMYPRQVILKNGYDRFIKPLTRDSEVCKAVEQFIYSVCPSNDGMFSNVFHLQLAKDVCGDFYFIEFSKRISGTSVVNIDRGMDPFAFIKGEKMHECTPYFKFNEWYRYEDFLIRFGYDKSI